MKLKEFVHSGELKLALYQAKLKADRPVVLLLHGYPDCAQVWQPMAERLEAEFNVFAYDVRGCGRSDTPANVAAYAFEYLMQDLSAVIDHISPDSPVHLVAHDWGSFQGWEAVTSTELAPRIASYTSISGPCLDHVALRLRGQLTSESTDDLLGGLRQLGKSWYMGFFQIPGIAPQLWRRLGKRGWPMLAKRLDGTIADGSPTRARDGANGVNLYRANLLNKLLNPQQRSTEVPVQLLVPTQDPFADIKLYDEAPKWCGELVRHDIDAGHWVISSHADWVAERIQNFVSNPPARRAPNTEKALVGQDNVIADSAIAQLALRGSEYLPFASVFALQASQPRMRLFAWSNLAAQLALFIPVACIPAARSGKMSYVDVAWPFGLVLIGLQTLLYGRKTSLQTYVVAQIYIIMGLRMGLGALWFELSGEWSEELPRYRYQRLRWEKRGLKNEAFAMQYEILQQCAGNASILAMPAMLTVAGKGKKFGLRGVATTGLWLGSWAMESLADLQKRRFAEECKQRGEKRSCDVGLWRYSRHPNYFFQWMQWNSLILLTRPNLSELQKQGTGPMKTLALDAGLLSVSGLMAYVLLHYTGAKPAEHYSLQSRPDYAEYQQRTSIFVPWFPRAVKDRDSEENLEEGSNEHRTQKIANPAAA